MRSLPIVFFVTDSTIALKALEGDGDEHGHLHARDEKIVNCSHSGSTSWSLRASFANSFLWFFFHDWGRSFATRNTGTTTSLKASFKRACASAASYRRVMGG